MIQVKEVQAKSVLNRSKIYPYCLNPYTGCQVGCAYCYARLFIPRYTGHAEPWGTFVDVKVNAPLLLRGQVSRARPDKVWISSVCDPYQPVEKTYRLTRQCLEVLLESRFPVVVQTKSVLALRDLDLFTRFPSIEVGFTVATDDQTTARLFEPRASPVEERARALGELRSRGVRTFAFAGPLLPGNPERLAALLDGKADRVLIDRVNYKPFLASFYRAHGLSEALSESFDMSMKLRLVKALRARHMDFETLF